MQEERGPEGEDEMGGPFVVAVGAHYKPNTAAPEEVLLHIIKVAFLSPNNEIYILLTCSVQECYIPARWVSSHWELQDLFW